MFFGGLIFLVGCQGIERKELRLPGQPVTIVDTAAVLKTDSLPTEILETGKTRPAEVVSYARTLLGTPYLYASANPANGFDCSGFITYVFNHFGIQVPRSSVDFTNVGKEIPLEKARSGDIILFTGTDSTIPVVGHMGIITTSEKEAVQFIHSTSGKAKGVVITPLENYYRSRFVKVIRIFPDYYFTEV
jgi:cell wall-associated NlpC family hydrolase